MIKARLILLYSHIVGQAHYFAKLCTSGNLHAMRTYIQALERCSKRIENNPLWENCVYHVCFSDLPNKMEIIHELFKHVKVLHANDHEAYFHSKRMMTHFEVNGCIELMRIGYKTNPQLYNESLLNTDLSHEEVEMRRIADARIAEIYCCFCYIGIVNGNWKLFAFAYRVISVVPASDRYGGALTCYDLLTAKPKYLFDKIQHYWACAVTIQKRWRKYHKRKLKKHILLICNRKNIHASVAYQVCKAVD